MYTCILTYFFLCEWTVQHFFIENTDTLYALLLQAHANSNNPFMQISVKKSKSAQVNQLDKIT